MSVAEEFKAQGNSYFVSLEYSNAIDCYSKSLIALDEMLANPSSVQVADPKEFRKLVLSNRAQSYLKLKAYHKAFADADAALQLDPVHVKSLGRRGTACYYLDKFRQAKRDFVVALGLDPNNKQFREYLKKTDERLNKIRGEAYERMVRRATFTDLTELMTERDADLPLTELHLDEKVNKEMVQKKVEVIQRQEENKTQVVSKKTNKKHKKKTKRKAMDDFFEGDDQEAMKQYLAD